MHAAIVADVVAVVEARRGIERQQPDRVHAEIGDVVELGDQAGKIADAVVVGIEERLDMQLVDDRVLVPQRVSRSARPRSWRHRQWRRRPSWCSRRCDLPDRERQIGGIEADALAACRSRRSGGRASGRLPPAPRHPAGPIPTTESRLPLPATPWGSRLTATRIMSRVAGCSLAIQQHLIVERRIEGHAEMSLQRGMRPADAVERR